MIYSNESSPLSLKHPSGRKLSFLNPLSEAMPCSCLLPPFLSFFETATQLFPQRETFSHPSEEARSSHCVALQEVIYWADPRGGVSTTSSQVETWLSSKQTKFTSYTITSLCKHILLWHCLCRRGRKAEIVKYRITKQTNGPTGPGFWPDRKTYAVVKVNYYSEASRQNTGKKSTVSEIKQPPKPHWCSATHPVKMSNNTEAGEGGTHNRW